MLILAAALTCLMLAVMITDVTRYIIPNWLVLLLFLLYPVMIFTTHTRPDWLTAIYITLAVFVFGLLVLFRFMGGGDVKLLTVASLWVGAKSFAPFIMGVAVIGGALGLFLLLVRPLVAYGCLKAGIKPESIPRVLTISQPLPYGLAIASSFLIVLWTGQMPGVPL